MIKVTVLYANTPGARFDHAYYRDVHMPMIAARLGAACKGYSVDRGIAGGAPGTPPPYLAMCHILVDSMEAFSGAMVPHQREVSADVARYTDLTPQMQISEVVV